MENTTQTTPEVKKGKWKKRILITLISIIVLYIIYVFICGISYSTGARTGVVIKISQKGYIFKTYEGELNLGGISEGDGTIMPTKIWKFSVDRNDTATYNAITNTQGKHIRLHYKEVLKNFFWQGETTYFVEKMEVVH